MADKSEKSRRFSPKFSSRIKKNLLSKAEYLDGEPGDDIDLTEITQDVEVQVNSFESVNFSTLDFHALGSLAVNFEQAPVFVEPLAPSLSTIAALEVDIGVSQDDHAEKPISVKAEFQNGETAQRWRWRRTRLNRYPLAESQMEVKIPIPHSEDSNFRLAPDSAATIVRLAIDLLKQNPDAFSTERAELRSLVIAHNLTTQSHVLSGEKSTLPVVASQLADVAKWLLSYESVTLAALRNFLLPLDMLPCATVDEINEVALDLTGERALEEADDEIVVGQELLAQVLNNWREFS